jgi:DNA helicase-2/ATP-dependent DNA helicase PcrA
MRYPASRGAIPARLTGHRTMEPLLDQLNEQQREAVLATEGPVLIIAGAGSGKTRVLTTRAAYLILGLGIPPEEITLVTFTNKAAGEMKERMSALLRSSSESPGGPAGIRMGTFHALCLRILRVEAAHLGYTRDFVVFDTADQSSVMKDVVAELGLDPERLAPRALLHRVSAARNRFVSPQDIDAALDDPASGGAVLRAKDLYAKKLRAANAMDFDDLILNVLALFRQQPELERKYRDRTRYLMVDEYQDTNRSQYALVAALAAGSRNLCVVGDDSQSIYRFRGADIGNILRFNEDYPDAKTIHLTRNYRSTGRILEAADNVIRHNHGRIDKELWTENPEGELITFLQAATDRDEATFVAEQIRAFRRGPDGRDLSDVAVLYRTNAQSRLIEEAFVKSGIPYRIYGGLRFYDRKEIKDLMAYLRLVANPADDVSLKRILNVPPRGLGKVTLDTLEEAARAEGISLFASVEKSAMQTPPARWSRALRALVDTLSDLRERAAAGEMLSVLIRDLVDRLEYQAYLRKNEPGDVESRIENIQQLIAAAQEREAGGDGDLAAFLDAAALVSDIESVSGDTGVNLMTLHCAKGLEFPVVFMVGMEENLFPHVRSVMAADNAEIEEERRLCYVGMTRAEQRLVLSCARERRSFGSLTANEPSRFISEVGSGLMRDLSADWMAAAGYRTEGYRGRLYSTPRRAPAASPSPSLGDEDISAAPDDDDGATTPGAGLRVGMKVFHVKFGYGEVEGLDGLGEKQKATVRFSGWGRMKLMTRYANLQRVAR